MDSFAQENQLAHEATRKPEVISNMEISRAPLGDALAFWVHLERQEDLPMLINQLRCIGVSDAVDEKWLITQPDSLDTLFGYISSKDQFDHFVDCVSQYDGRYSLGQPNKDAQFSVACKTVQLADTQEQRTIRSTSSTSDGVNAGARIIKSEKKEHFFRTREIRDNFQNHTLLAYQYLDEADLEKLTREGKKVEVEEGPKNTGLRHFVIDETYFDTHDCPPVKFDSNNQENIDFLRSEFHLEQEVLESQDLTKFVVSADVNSFSGYTHRLVAEGNVDERNRYLDSIMRFFDAIENELFSLVGRDDSLRKLLSEIRLLEWRGDAGGLSVPHELQDILVQAVTNVMIDQFDAHKVKAFISEHKQLTTQKSPSGRVLSVPELEETDKEATGFLDEKNKGRDKSEAKRESSIIVLGADRQPKMIAVIKQGMNGRGPEIYMESSNLQKTVQTATRLPRN